MANRMSEIVIEIENEKKKLISNRDHVQMRAKATGRLYRVSDAVLEWRKDVEEFIEQEENLKLIIRTEKETSHRYRMHEDMLKKIQTLNAKSDIEPFYMVVKDAEYIIDGKFVYLNFESTREASDQLREALEDESTHIIGLYGERKSGKTFLAESVRKRAWYRCCFDVVLLATVSKNPDIVKRIQHQIAGRLGLIFDNEGEAGRARLISDTVQGKGRILVILDDVREKFELKDIGIPPTSNQCKVLLTARSQQEYTWMNCQRKIPLNPLSEEDAWNMFKNSSGIKVESPSDLLNLAKKVVFECKGLLGKIDEVGSSLKINPLRSGMHH